MKLKKRIIQYFFCVLFLLLPCQDIFSWGFWAHKKINRIAVFTLPVEMMGFYKKNINYLSEHAIDPDKRRYAFKAEAPRHYIDLEPYGKLPFDSLPRKWKDAVAKYTEDTLQAYGIVPWHVQRMYYRLRDAFELKDAKKILKTSADIGHYIADAHVPLHTTINYNGQLTNQVGIHGLLESRIPELFGEEYDFFVGKAELIDDPLLEIWDVVLTSHASLDSVFKMELEATAETPSDQKYAYDERGVTTVNTYSKEFCKLYSDKLNGLVERRMRAAIFSVGSFWYSAWVDAGQPNLDSLDLRPLSEEEKQKLEAIEKEYRSGKGKGRLENN